MGETDGKVRGLEEEEITPPPKDGLGQVGV